MGTPIWPKLSPSNLSHDGGYIHSQKKDSNKIGKIGGFMRKEDNHVGAAFMAHF